jgi:PAS domain S-box-containing protein
MGMAEILALRREEIIEEWARRLHTEVSARYSARPIEELFSYISEATEANFAVLAENDFSKIDAFIEKVAEVRWAAGFPLTDVLRAFELYRSIVVPMVTREIPPPALTAALEQLNSGLSYTIYRFSDYFQRLHKKEITSYAQSLEKEVENRTNELRESENKFRSLAEKSLVGVCLIQDDLFRYVNSTFEGIFGYSTEETVDRLGPKDMAFPAHWPVAEGNISKGMTGEIPSVRYQFRGVRKDGTVINVEAYGSRAVYQGKPAVISTVLDITERRRAEDKLQESEKKYRELVENLAEGVFQSTPGGRFITVNPALARMWGFSSPQEMVESVTDIAGQHYVIPDERATFKQLLERDGSVKDFEHQMYRKDGTIFWVSVSARAVKDRDGKVLYYEGTSENTTKRKHAEEALKKSEALLRSVVSASPVGIALDTAERVIIWVNDAMARISGYTPEELQGRSARIFYPSDQEFARAGEIIHNEVFAGRIGVTETKFLGKDGQIRDIQLTAAPVDANDVSAGIVFVVADITERKRAEEELQKAHRQLSDIIDFLPDATFVIDREKRVVAWNKAIEEMTGVKKEEILGKGDYAYAVPFYGEPRPVDIDLVFARKVEIEKTYDHVQEEGSKLSVEVYVPKIYRGRGAYLSATASPLFDHEGNVVGAIESIRDTTEQKRIEKALQESEERYRTAIESSNEGVALVKGDRHIYVNRKFLEIFGYRSLEEVIGQTHYLTVHPDDREKVVGYNRRRQRGEPVPDRYEFKGLRGDGETVYIEASVTTTTYQGEPITLAFMRDVSERKSLEAQLRQAQKMEAIGTLAGGVAHDFNNILMVLMGYANLMQMKMDQNDPLRIYVDQILASTGKAANLTQSLLTFGRKQVIELKPHKVDTLLRDVEKLLNRLLPEDMGFKVFLGADAAVMADMTQIAQVLVNLATNARDAMPRGGDLKIETACVEIDGEFKRVHGFGEPGKYALVSVADTGTGMDEKTKERIFEPFFTTKEVGKGTGLGLSIVYGIVKQHGGYITVESQPGEGTVFRIYLPEVKAEVAPETKEAPPDPQGGAETILLAEDNPDIRRMTSYTLAMSGYTVIEAADGRDAVEKFREHRDEIKLAILDVVMPEKNGKEAYEEIRTMKYDIKALFMSGYTSDVVLAKGVFAKAPYYIAKPIAPNELLRHVRNILDG